MNSLPTSTLPPGELRRTNIGSLELPSSLNFSLTSASAAAKNPIG